jgi:hypothetical protein
MCPLPELVWTSIAKQRARHNAAKMAWLESKFSFIQILNLSETVAAGLSLCHNTHFIARAPTHAEFSRSNRTADRQIGSAGLFAALIRGMLPRSKQR